MQSVNTILLDSCFWKYMTKEWPQDKKDRLINELAEMAKNGDQDGTR